MIKLFTHTDLDGIGCAILAKLAFGEKVDVSYCDYGDVNEEVSKYVERGNEFDMYHITDIRIDDELAGIIDEKFDNFYLLDHHPTAVSLKEYIWCTVKIEDENTNIKTSGTELYYKWLVSNGYLKESDFVKRFVELVRDYDTWRWKSLEERGVICKKINDLLYLYGKDKFIDWCLNELHLGTFPKLHESDKMVLEIKQREIDKYVEEKSKQLFTGTLCGRTCGFVFAEMYCSELGNRLCEMHPEIDFVVMINMNGTISYRTIRDDIDLGKDVAAKFGGGGHPKAAGSSFEKTAQLDVIRSVFR